MATRKVTEGVGTTGVAMTAVVDQGGDTNVNQNGDDGSFADASGDPASSSDSGAIGDPTTPGADDGGVIVGDGTDANTPPVLDDGNPVTPVVDTTGTSTD